jgi:hypothetical protein
MQGPWDTHLTMRGNVSNVQQLSGWRLATCVTPVGTIFKAKTHLQANRLDVEKILSRTWHPLPQSETRAPAEYS